MLQKITCVHLCSIITLSITFAYLVQISAPLAMKAQGGDVVRRHILRLKVLNVIIALIIMAIRLSCVKSNAFFGR